MNGIEQSGMSATQRSDLNTIQIAWHHLLMGGILLWSLMLNYALFSYPSGPLPSWFPSGSLTTWCGMMVIASLLSLVATSNPLLRFAGLQSLMVSCYLVHTLLHPHADSLVVLLAIKKAAPLVIPILMLALVVSAIAGMYLRRLIMVLTGSLLFVAIYWLLFQSTTAFLTQLAISTLLIYLVSNSQKKTTCAAQAVNTGINMVAACYLVLVVIYFL